MAATDMVTTEQGRMHTAHVHRQSVPFVTLHKLLLVAGVLAPICEPMTFTSRPSSITVTSYIVIRFTECNFSLRSF